MKIIKIQKEDIERGRLLQIKSRGITVQTRVINGNIHTRHNIAFDRDGEYESEGMITNIRRRLWAEPFITTKESFIEAVKEALGGNEKVEIEEEEFIVTHIVSSEGVREAREEERAYIRTGHHEPIDRRGTIITEESIELIKTHPEVERVIISGSRRIASPDINITIWTKPLFLNIESTKFGLGKKPLPLGRFRITIKIKGSGPEDQYFAEVMINSLITEEMKVRRGRGRNFFSYFDQGYSGSMCYGEGGNETAILRNRGLFSLVDNTIRIIALSNAEGGGPRRSWEQSYRSFITALVNKATVDSSYDRENGLREVEKKLGIEIGDMIIIMNHTIRR